MSDRTRARTAPVKQKVELPETVTLYPDAHFVPGDQQFDAPVGEIITVSRERAMELLAIGRRHTDPKTGKTTPSWDGEEICPAYHLEIQLARFDDQRGEENPNFADWPDVDEKPAAKPQAEPRPVKPSKALIAATERTPEESGPPDNPADQAADQTSESAA